MIGPDGKRYSTAVGEGVTQEQANAFKRHVRQRHARSRDSFLLNGWAAETGGEHELVVTTNATIDTTASGRIAVRRPRVVRIRGNETSAPLSINASAARRSPRSMRSASSLAPALVARLASAAAKRRVR